MSSAGDYPWIAVVLAKHHQLTPLVSSLLQGVLKARSIDYLSVSGRTKDLESVLDKIKRKSYDNPEKQLTDLSGIRVITFFDSQVHKVCEIIREVFEVDEENSLDKADILGNDRVGYRSVHFVCTLGSSRLALPEYRDLCDLSLEVQVRTVLQHGWAEITHDRSYKFGGSLPAEIQRKLNLYAGMLEIVDGGFDEVANEIDDYAASLRAASEAQLDKESLNSISLSQFISELQTRLSIVIKETPASRLEEVIKELRKCGVQNIGDISKLITQDFVRNYRDFHMHEDAATFVRSMLMYNDVDAYVEKSGFKWQLLDQQHVDFFKKKWGEEKFNEILKKYKILLRSSEEAERLVLKMAQQELKTIKGLQIGKK